MDSTLAQLLQALSGNAAPNIMGNPGGIAGSRLAYMQGQNANANQLLNQRVFTGQQGINAMGGAQQAREAMAAPGGALNPAQGGAPPAQAFPPVQAAPVPQPPPMGQPAPNPPGAMQQQLPQNVPIPGASPIPQMSMSQTGGQQNGQGQLSPQQAQDMQQTLQQNLQGMHAPQYKDIINAVKQAMPNATPMQRALATAEIMKDVNSQTNEVLKQYQQAILSARLNQGQERMNIQEDRLGLAKDKAGLGNPAAQNKILNFTAEKAQASGAGGLGGKLNQARSDMSAAAQSAMQTAMGYLPKDANALETYVSNTGASFTNDPKYAAFKSKNTMVAGEIARVQAGGKSPTQSAIQSIEDQLNKAGTQAKYQAIVDSYLGSGEAMSKASQATTNRGGGLAPDAAAAEDPNRELTPAEMEEYRQLGGQ